MAFFGAVFNHSELPISTFTASQRYVGINMRTFPSDPTPGIKSTGKIPSLPPRSLLEMHDKTTWNTQNDIGMWDGTANFKKN
ncbi:hypothetical protein VTO73DRAFT_7198 [Trametes versicolor]